MQQHPIYEQKLMKSGIDALCDLPWGFHMCQFYQDKLELLEVLVPYFKAGLENNEYCLWVVSKPLLEKEAHEALQSRCANLDTYIKKEQIYIVSFEDWYIKGKNLSAQSIIDSWIGKINKATISGLKGIRVSGDAYWSKHEEWENILEYEKELDKVVSQMRMIGLCTYQTSKCTVAGIIEVFKFHEYVLVKKNQNWEIVESVENARIKAADAYKMRQEQFIDTLCHELRNPLNGVFGSVDLMNDELQSTEDELQSTEKALKDLPSEQKTNPLANLNALRRLSSLREYSEIISHCIKYQKTLLDDVLNVSKLQSHKVKLCEVEFDPNKIILEVCEIFKSEITRKGYTLHTELQKYEVFVAGDPDRLKQILVNLVSNAIKFNSINGKITIQLELISRGNELTELSFSVEDSGIGMTHDEVSRLFNRFEQMQRNTHSKYEGSGLGLVISKGLVELMGGHFTVESQKQKGTKFNFNAKFKTAYRSPVTRYNKVDDASKIKTAFACVRRVGIKVLIAEDNIINQKLLSKQLSQEGCICFVANNGQEAIDIFKKQPLDIILMDLEMPVMSGLQAIKLIRENGEVNTSRNTSSIPIICLSGYNSDKYIDSAIIAGANAYVTKPYEKAKLFQNIIECITKINQPLTVSQLNWAEAAMGLTFFRANRGNVALQENNFSIKNSVQLTAEYLGEKPKFIVPRV